MFGNCFGNFGNWLGGILPRFLATFTFLPCGLLMGYTISSFSVDFNNLKDFLYYGPLILGCFTALITAIIYVGTKFWRNKILFFHFEILIATTIINIIACILFFINKLDIYGSYIAFISYGMTFITALTYLNIISSKDNRTIILSLCFAWYLFGLASAVSLIDIHVKYNSTKINNLDSTTIIHKPETKINNIDFTTIINDLNFSAVSNELDFNMKINNNITTTGLLLSFLNDTDTIDTDDNNLTISQNQMKLNNYYKIEHIDSKETNHTNGIYKGMAAVYLTSTLLLLIILIIIKIYNYLGNLEYKKSLDYDIFIANSNETIFDTRSEVIKQTNFFYVTKSKQWLVSFILLFCDAIHFSFFIYITSWFIFNPEISLTKSYGNYGLLYWIVFFGSILGLLALLFVSIKIIFVTSTIFQILLLFLGVLIRKTTLIPLWIVCFLYGVNFSNIQVQVLETSHLKYSELMIFISCATKLFSIGVINVSFMSDSKNSIFYREDSATLIAHSLAYVTISSLIAIIVSIKVPRTYKNSLFDIQNCLLGIIYRKHQIEQLNMKYLNDGTIPTISKTVDRPQSSSS